MILTCQINNVIIFAASLMQCQRGLAHDRFFRSAQRKKILEGQADKIGHIEFNEIGRGTVNGVIGGDPTDYIDDEIFGDASIAFNEFVFDGHKVIIGQKKEEIKVYCRIVRR